MKQRSETNSVQKVCMLLRALSSPSPRRLKDLAAETGLDKASILRVLETLTAEGYVTRDDTHKTFQLGDQSILLGLAMQQRLPVVHLARPFMLHVAANSGDTALLLQRMGNEAVCMDREFGGYPIRANYLEVGTRRPLGLSSGGLALLAWLPDDEIKAVLDISQATLQRNYPTISRSFIEDQVARAREQGYACVLNLLVEQMGGIAVPLFGADGRPFASIVISALARRVEERRDTLAALLQETAESFAKAHTGVDQTAMLARHCS
ncbi:MAG TPA: IclR family transcriptional regulator [Orrella sp.]